MPTDFSDKEKPLCYVPIKEERRRKEKELIRNPEVIKQDIKACAERLNLLLIQRANYIDSQSKSFFFDEEGNAVYLTNPLQEKIDQTDAQIDEALHTLAKLKSERDSA